MLKVVIVAYIRTARLTREQHMKALDIASYFVQLANNTTEHDLTNLKLQKLLYYAQGKHLAENSGEALFDDHIEAWQYGPVVKDVYHTFKRCGVFPVTIFDINYDASELEDNHKDFIQKIWKDIGTKYSANYLVTKTHANGTPWKQYYNESDRNIEIPNSALIDYFTSHNL
jgi:YD repeat-containing protein